MVHHLINLKQGLDISINKKYHLHIIHSIKISKADNPHASDQKGKKNENHLWPNSLLFS